MKKDEIYNISMSYSKMFVAISCLKESRKIILGIALEIVLAPQFPGAIIIPEPPPPPLGGPTPLTAAALHPPLSWLPPEPILEKLKGGDLTKNAKMEKYVICIF